MPAPPDADATLTSFSLAGRVGVVTGAAGLLGTPALPRAGRRGRGAWSSTDIDEARALRRRGAGGQGRRGVTAVAADITDAARWRRCADATLCASVDRIDVLVNNAAINDMFERPGARPSCRDSRTTRWSLPADRWTSTSPAPSSACQVLGSRDGAAREGSIINIASHLRHGRARSAHLSARRRDAGLLESRRLIRPARARSSRSRGSWRRRGASAASASTASRRAGSGEAGQDPTFVANYSERTPARADGGGRPRCGGDGVPGQRRIELHDRRQPRRRRRLDRVVTLLESPMIIDDEHRRCHR